MQLLGMVLVFVLVLAATYYVTKWIAKSGAVQSHSKNIRVIETFKIAPNKYIQIIQLGDRYYSIGVSKEQITFLTPLDKEQLELNENDSMPMASGLPFKEVMERMAAVVKKNKKNQ